jgi:hypothetical protein
VVFDTEHSSPEKANRTVPHPVQQPRPPTRSTLDRMEHSGHDAIVTESRAALRAFVVVGEVEHWIAEQPWQPATWGWTVMGELHGWRFRVEPDPGGVRVVMSMAGGEPATWIVPAC